MNLAFIFLFLQLRTLLSNFLNTFNFKYTTYAAATAALANAVITQLVPLE